MSDVSKINGYDLKDSYARNKFSDYRTAEEQDDIDAGVVRFDEAQPLTDAQQAQVRNNINAVEGDEYGTTLQEVIDALNDVYDDCELISNKATNLEIIFTDHDNYPSAKAVISYLTLDESRNGIQNTQYKDKTTIDLQSEGSYRANPNLAKKQYPSIYALFGYVDRKISDTIDEIDEGKQDKAQTQTVTIAVADWSGGTTCTKSVTGVTATSIVIVDTSDGNVECTGQGAGTLTFTATSTPTSVVTAKVVIL